MVSIKWNKCNDVAQVLNRVANQLPADKIDDKNGYRAARIFAAIVRNGRDMVKEHQKISEKWCKKDEKLNPVKDEMGQYVFRNPEDGENCLAEVDKLFSEKQVTVNVMPLERDVLRKALNRSEMVALEEILDKPIDE